MKRTPLPIWSDGIHYVRMAGETDTHALRWLAAAHRATPSTLFRHCPTMDDALRSAMRASKAWLAQHPSDRQHFTSPLLPAASGLPGPKKIRGRPPKIKLPTFSTYHFNCIRANPVAQVWQCVSVPGEHGPVGRKAAGGRAPKQAGFYHAKGECAVMKAREPVREEDGQVRVFPTWQAAEDFALELYHTADEEDRLLWEEPEGKVVGRSENVDIIFDPAVNGAKRPFSLWLPKWNKPVYTGFRKAHYAKAGQLTGGGTFLPGTQDEKDALALNLKLAAMDDRKTLTDEPAKFESIWGAEHHAIHITERVLRGEAVEP